MHKDLAKEFNTGADSSQILAEEITKSPAQCILLRHPVCRIRYSADENLPWPWQHPGHIGESLTAKRVVRLARPDERLSHQAQVSPVGDSSDHRRDVCERVEGIDLTH